MRKISNWVVLGTLGTLGILGVFGCTKRDAAQAPAERVVHLASWSNYIMPATVAEFEKTTGIKLKVSNYSSNEELLAKLQAGASSYDVIVPSDYMVFAMSKQNLLRKLESSKIKTFGEFDKRVFAKEHDPKNEFSIPYAWGTTGIAVNTTLYKGEIKGWKHLFNHVDLAGKLTLLDDSREVIAAALKSLGYSLNSVKPEELAKAKEVLLKVRPRVKAFNAEPKTPLMEGEIPVGHCYMSEGLQVQQKTGGKVKYVVPVEGATLWIDNLAIPSTSLHVEEAYALINYLSSAKGEAALVQGILVSPSNAGVFALLPKELQTNTQLFPTEAMLSQHEMMKDLGEGLALWDRLWTEVKAQR